MHDPHIVILAGVQSAGVTYQLHPVSRERVHNDFPGAQRAPSVFVGFSTAADFETLHGSMWGQVVMMLTGVSLKRLEDAGFSVVVRVPSTGRDFEVRA